VIMPLTEEAKRLAEQKCAKRPNIEIPNPGTMYTAKDGRVWVFAVDKVTRVPLWVQL
jgi:hypothetical protein